LLNRVHYLTITGIAMSYIEAIKDGCRVAYKNWQLIVIQLCMMVITGIGFFIFVGIPLIVALITLGVDLTSLVEMNDISEVFQNTSLIISRYFGLFILIVACLLVYILAATTFGIYVFGGTVGIIGRAFVDKDLKFTMHTFFSEARRLFFPILGFTALVGLAVIVLLFLLVIIGGGIMLLVSLIKTQHTMLAFFLGTFLTLISIIIAGLFILGIISITFFGVAELSFRGTGPMKSLKEATHYVLRNQKAFWLYPLLLVGYLLINIILAFSTYPFSLIPPIGIILLFPYQLLSYVFLTYIGIAMIATVFAYYYSTEMLGWSEVPPKSFNALS
jgi:hypothetical protein